MALQTERRRLVWSGFTLACLLTLAFARVGQDRALDRSIDDATAHAQVYASQVVGPQVRSSGGASAISVASRSLTTVAEAEILTDPTVARVRVYGLDGSPLFASNGSRGLVTGSAGAAVESALAGEQVRLFVREPFTYATTGSPGTPTDLVEVFVPLRKAERVGVVGVVEVDFLKDELRTISASPWPSIQLAAGALLLICLALAVIAWVPSRRRYAHAPADEGSMAEGNSEIAATPDVVEPPREAPKPEPESGQLQADAKPVAADVPEELTATRGEAASTQAEDVVVVTVEEHATAEVVTELAEAPAGPAAKKARPKSKAPAKKARVGAAPAVSSPPEPKAPPEPEVPPEPKVPPEHRDPELMLDELERRVDEAEERAREAAGRLDSGSPDGGLVPVEPDGASDLRVRLARAAASKKRGGEG